MKKERNIWWLIATISSISILAWFTNTYDPINPARIVVFFVLLWITTVTLGLFITRHGRRSVLLSIGVVGFFLLQLLSLRDFFYPLLLLASLVSLEMYLNKR